MTKYKLIKEHLFHPHIGEYKAYGIAAYNGHKLINKISDISISRQEVRRLCRLCNKLQLAPEHIGEVIEDFLCANKSSPTR